MRKENKRGISLIVLVITILVIIILATAVILTLNNTGVTNKAKKAAFLQTYNGLKDSLTLRISNMYLESKGEVTTETIDAIEIKSLNENLSNEEAAKFDVQNRQIVLTAEASDTEKSWVGEYNESAEQSAMSLNIHFGNTAPGDTSKLWIKGASSNNISLTYTTPLSTTNISTLSSTLNQGVFGAAIGRYNNYIYIIGGSINNTVSGTNIIQAFDITTNNVSTISATLPINLAYMSSATVGDSVYLFGGRSNVDTNKIFKFNMSTQTITQLDTVMPTNDYVSAASAVGTDIYIFGGAASKKIYKFNTVDNTLQFISNLSSGDGSMKAVTVGTNIYLIGNMNNTKIIRKFDTLTNNLTVLSVQLSTGCQATSVNAFENKIYIFGGYITGNSYLNTISIFDISANTLITSDARLNATAYAIATEIYNNNIYLFGGGNSSTSYNTIQKFTISQENLAENSIKIFQGTFGKSFNLINNENINIPCYPIACYRGNSENKAELAEAYLYNTTTSSWELLR